ncbi:transposase [Haloarcula sp. 1CSR25-25]|uniref:transposase n=1 Tax=Haloarcula sp. 1CSR25-25 TaxID=2862545 RepID=UPI00289E68A2|nr:transposase [Haloarcula sp. 1CSR25-25]
MCDREFSTHQVRETIDRKGMTYIIPKPVQAKQDRENIRKVNEHPEYDAATVTYPLTVDERTHNCTFIYLPSTRESGGYTVFTTNADADRDRGHGLVAQYRDRWMIENEYKTIKKNFLPMTTSKDYRVRLFYFVSAVIMYNIWRLTNLLLRDMVDTDLGESPPVTAGEIAEIVGLCLGTGIG